MRRLIFLCLAIAAMWQSSYAQQFRYVPELFSVKSNSDSIAAIGAGGSSTYHDSLSTAIYDQWTSYVLYKNGTPGFTSYNFKSIQDIIRVGVRHNNMHVAKYKYRLTFNVLKYDYPNPNIPASVEAVSLDFGFDPDSLQAYDDLAVYRFSGYLKFRLILTGVYDISGTAPVPVTRAALGRNFFIESEISAQRYMENFGQLLTDCSESTADRSIAVRWGTKRSNVVNSYCKLSDAPLSDLTELKPVTYELEWLYLDDYRVDLSATPPAKSYKFTTGQPITYSFVQNATRIQTNSTAFNIPLVYEHGAVIYRVRAVRPVISSGYKDVSYSAWSLPDAGSVTPGTSCFSAQGFLITAPHSNDSLNWQYSIQFAEEGKYKHVINYLDGALKDRQTQTKINSNGNYIIAAEKVYDYEGRPVIQTLPVPVQQQGLAYRRDIAMNSATGKAYSAADLDGLTAAPTDSIPQLAPASLANKYYSRVNTDTAGMQKFVPDAKGYPFIRSEYSPDNTNKLLWQGGAGRELQLFKGHGIRNSYATAFQPELNKLLGTEVGYEEFYPKQVTRDANGQASFSVINPAGKVIATGLQGLPDTAGKPVDLLSSYSQGEQLCTDLLHDRHQELDKGNRSVSVPYFSDKANNQTYLRYTVSVPPFPAGCGKFLRSQAQYHVRVTGEDGTHIIDNVDSTGPDSVLSSNTSSYKRGDSLGAVLANARYTISKDLRFSEYDVKKQVREFITANEPACFHDQPYFVRKAVEAAKFPCRDTVKKDYCEQKLDLMLKDMYPKAKYGTYQKSAAGVFQYTATNSIFQPLATGVSWQRSNSLGLTSFASGEVINSQGQDLKFDYTTPVNGIWQPYQRCPTAVISGQDWCTPRADSFPQPYHGGVKLRTFITVSAEALSCTHIHLCYKGTEGSNFGGTNVIVNGLHLGPNHLGGTENMILQNLRIGVNEVEVLVHANGYNYPNDGTQPMYMAISFSLDCNTSAYPKTCLYQAPCITLPSPVTIDGRTYSSLRDIDPQTLIDGFNDTIARALLPLHPEYCKLATCNEGPFEEELENIETSQEAEAANRFWVDSIAAHDPMYVNATAAAKPQIHYQLSHMRNFRRLDSMAIEMAYCSAGNAAAATQCATTLYPAEIAQFIFIDSAVKQQYFSALKRLYLANRGLNYHLLYDTASATCESCPSLRLKQTGSSAFPTIFTEDTSGFGGVMLDSAFASQSWVDTVYNKIVNGDTTGFSSNEGRVSATAAEATGGLCDGLVQAVIKDLINCSADTVSGVPGHPLYTIRQILTSRCSGSSNGLGLSFRPALIDSVIGVAGLQKNDLCHAFLINYGLYDPASDPAQLQYSCGDSALYQGMTAFLNRPAVQSAIAAATSFSGAGSGSFSLDANNPYEAAIAATTGPAVTVTGYDFTLPAGTPGAMRFVKLTLGGTATVTLYLRSKLNGAPQLNGLSGVTFSAGRCTNGDPEGMLGQGRNAKYTALVSAAQSGTTRDYYIWSKEIPLMNTSDASEIAGCITCNDLLHGMQAFHADSAAWHYDAVTNHPLYRRTLTNYLNFTLRKNNTYYDYEGLTTGCALSDKLDLPKYRSSYELVFSSYAAATAFTDALQAAGTGMAIPSTFIYSSGGNVHCGINLGAVATEEVGRYKRFADAYSSGVIARNYRHRPAGDLILVPDTICAAPLTVPGAYGTLSGAGAALVGPQQQHTAYSAYTFAQAGSTPLQHADAMTAVRAAISAQCPSAQYFSGLAAYRPEDYADAAKQQYLSYIYSQTSSPHDAVVASVSPAALAANLSLFSGKAVTYDDPICYYTKRDLYVYTPKQTGHPGYQLLNTILQRPDTLFPTSVKHKVSDSVFVFRKANGDFWYRYFDAANRLRNLYLTPPSGSSAPLSAYRLDSVHTAQGGDSSRAFTAWVHLPAAPQVAIACPGYADFTTGYSRKVSGVILLDRGNSNDLCRDTADCEYGVLVQAAANGRARYSLYNDSLNRVISDSMMRFLVSRTVDSLRFCSFSQKYHYTLYYYDRAGNLVRTVPPAGVAPVTASVEAISDARSNASLGQQGDPKTAHKKKTVYRYDSKDQLIYQQTPDGGVTRFFYDLGGNLCFSQNSRQRPSGKYTYTLYDRQERPVETGEVTLGFNFGSNPAVDPDTARVNYPTQYGISGGYFYNPPVLEMLGSLAIHPAVLNQMIRLKIRNDVVITTYDEPRTALQNLADANFTAQENLTRRVSAIAYFPVMGADSNFNPAGLGDPKFTSHYSYDLNGNVATISYDYLPLASMKQRYKRVDYDYDLLSGKVNTVSYNRGRADQFYQHYEYDADNRITSVETSNDGLIWNKDARYSYYLHGPLAQVQLGDAQIQSLEYAYTIQGWLKAINGEVLNPDLDMGKNGKTGDLTYARDIVSHALNYFSGDYAPVANTAVTQLPEPAKGLYNGNIARQTTGIGFLGALTRDYRYDQLQRLKLGLTAAVNSTSLGVATPSAIYKNSYAYDPDGNITGLQRWDGAGAQIDNFTYTYNGSGQDNRLTRVSDAVNRSPAQYTDIKSGQPSDNYQYDRQGNLVRDRQGHLQSIAWNLAGKVTAITDSVAQKKIHYDYDGKGNRIYKEVVPSGGSVAESQQGEYYVRDAGGNILATYYTSKTYQNTILGIDTAMWNGNPTGFKNFMQIDMGSRSDFRAAVLSLASSGYTAWVDSLLKTKPPSWFIARGNGWHSQILGDHTTWMDSLRDYEGAGYTPVYVPAFEAAFQNSSNLPVEWIRIAANAGNAELRATMACIDSATITKGDAQGLWSRYMGPPPPHVPPPPPPAPPPPPPVPRTSATYSLYVPASENADSFAAVYDPNVTTPLQYPRSPLGIDIMAVLQNSPTERSRFFSGMIADNAIWQSGQLRGSGAGWEESLSGIVVNFGPGTGGLNDFYDYYWSGARNWLNANVSRAQRLAMLYDDPATRVAEQFALRIGQVPLANLIGGLPGMSVATYMQIVNNSSTGLAQYTGPADTMALAEHHIYGSSRLGVQTYARAGVTNVWQQGLGLRRSDLNSRKVWYSGELNDLVDSNWKVAHGHLDVSAKLKPVRTVGLRSYELSDHLGNVLATVLDRKTGVPGYVGSSTYISWKADVGSLTDYYPFGMVMPGRSYERGAGSKFGFNGQLKSDEVYGKGNLNTALFWEYDTRLGRRWNLDPRDQIYVSNYASFKNNPIFNVDILGDVVKSNRESVNTSQNINKASARSSFNEPVAAYISQSESKLKGSLSEKTGLDLSFNEEGIMQYKKNQDGSPSIAQGIFSEDARNDLIKVIDDSKFAYSINWAMGAGTINGAHSTLRGSKSELSGFVGIDIVDFKNNYKFYDVGMVFLHEMNHGYFGFTDDFICPEYREGDLINYGQRGETVMRVNTYEKQLGYPIRISYCDMGEGTFFQQVREKVLSNGTIKKIPDVISVEF